jgi:hypothetical protein
MTATITGAQLIAAERNRQIEKEGWDAEHDARHERGDLARAAICYAAPEPVFELAKGTDSYCFSDPWPWNEDDDKRARDIGTKELIPLRDLPKSQRIRNLVKAGALIAAEIDKLQAER